MARRIEPSAKVCARCGNPIRLWSYDWKHCRGWRSQQPSCGQRPLPMAREVYEDKKIRIDGMDRAVAALKLRP